MSYLPKKLLPYRSLIQNFTSLSFLQIANYIFPLIVLPYVVRVIGPSKYGLINFAAAFVAYFNIVCEYGFGLSGTKEVSISRDDNKKLNRVFSNIITTKVLLFTLCFIILLILISVVEILYINRNVILLSYGIVLGYTLFPGWFFQGIEQMKYITIIQVIVRIIITMLIFILINKEADFIKLVLLNAIAQISIGILGLLVAFYKFKIKYFIPSINQINEQLKSGWNIFQSMIAINIYTTSNTFILGLFADQNVVGYYAAADKIRQAFQGVIAIISQSTFPYVNKLAKESVPQFYSFIKKYIKVQIIIGLTISLILFIFAYQITDLLLGINFTEAGKLLQIVSGIPFLVSISNVIGLQSMIPLGYEKEYSGIISVAAFFHLIFLVVFVPAFFAVGASVSFLVTEFVVLLLIFIFILKKQLFSEKVGSN